LYTTMTVDAKQILLDHAETVRCPGCGFTRVVKAFWNEPWHPQGINARYNEPAIYCPNGCGYHTFCREGDGGVWKFETAHLLEPWYAVAGEIRGTIECPLVVEQ